MTEKRFTFMQDTLVKSDVFDNGEFVCCTLSVWVEQLVDLLNELHEGYLNLKHKHSLLHNECTDLEVERNRLQNDVNSLEKENKELNEQLSAMKSKGLKVLEFYEYKLKNADRKEFENAREELWIVKEVLCEMEVIKDE